MYKTVDQQKALHTQLLKWLSDCETSTAETIWNEEAQEDYKFYAGRQDTNEVIAALTAQRRPTTTYNEIAPKINMLAGMGDQLEGAVTLMPRTLADAPLTELMTGAVDFFREKMRQSRKETSCFEHAIKSGKSWLHFYVDTDDSENPIKSQRVPGRDIHSDPDSIEFDKSDMRFLFRDKWFTAEDIEAAFPEYKFPRDASNNINVSGFNQIRTNTTYTPTFFNEANDKYRVIEAWFRVYETKYTFVNPLTGKPESLFEEEFKEFASAVRKGITLPNGELLQKDSVPAEKKLTRSIYTAIITWDKIVEVTRSTYKHGMIPYVYLEAYHDEDYNTAMSVIKNMKDPQRGLNTTRRQLVFLLQQINKGILLHETGTILNIEDYEENSAKPGFHMELAKGGLEKVKFLGQPQISHIYGELDHLFQQSMKDSSGIQDALLGIQTSTREPGITARMRNDSSVAVLYTLFSNLKEFKYLCMKILVANIQQFVTETQMIRIRGKEGYQLMEINSQLNRESDGWNDITAAQFDLIIDEDIVTKSTRLAVAEILKDFAQNNPGSIPTDLLLEYANLPYTAQTRVRQQEESRQQSTALQQQMESNIETKKLELEERKVVVLEKEADATIALAKRPPIKSGGDK